MNASTSSPAALRPLGLGEVLDRAVTLTVRSFVPLAAIYVVFAIPLAIVQYHASRDLSALLQAMSTAVERGRAAHTPIDPAQIFRHVPAPAPGWGVLALALQLVIAPLPTAALIDATSARYFGRSVTFAGAYRFALGRWLPLVGLNLLYLAAGIAAYVALAIVVLVLAFAFALIAAASKVAAIVLGFAFAFVALLLLLAFACVALLAFETSYFTCVVERLGVVPSFARGITRVFGRIGLQRALLFGVAWIAIAVGIGVVSLAGSATLLGLVHSPVAATLYATVLRIVTVTFMTAFVAIFYFDLRVREEGFDLTLEARAAQTRTLSPT